MRVPSLAIAIGLATASAAFPSIAAANEATPGVVVGDPAGRCGAWIDYFAVHALPPGFEFHGGADFSGCFEKVASILPVTD